MPTFFFHSAMAGAPTNTNAAGSTLEIIRSCLVTGFNLKSVVSASVTSGVMTLNYAAPHGYEDKCWIRLDGAPAGTLVQRCTTSAGASTLTIPAPGFADGAVSGTLSTRVAPADWEKPFSDTNKAVFRSKVEGPGSTRFFYRVADTVSGSLPAMLRGFESMSDVDTGIGLFPSVAQVSGNGSSVLRSDSATARGWYIVCDGRTVYGACANDSANNYLNFFFGDQQPFGSADLFCAAVEGTMSLAIDDSYYNARIAAGTGASAQCSMRTLFSGSTARTYPSPIDGGMVFARPVMTNDGSSATSSALRGVMRGLLQCSAQPIPSGQGWLVMSASGVSGRTLVVRTGGSSFQACAFAIDEDWT